MIDATFLLCRFVMLRPALLAAAALLAGGTHADAGIVFDLTGDGGTFDNETIAALTIDGVTSTFNVTSSGGEFNSNAGDFGVDSPGDNGTTTDRFNEADGGVLESISITFDRNVSFDSLLLSKFQSSSTDQASINFNGLSAQTLTAQNASPETFTFNQTVAIGESVNFAFVSGDNFSFDQFTVTNLDAQAVPEPGSLALLGLSAAGMGLAGVRRKKRRGDEAVAA